VRMLYDFLVVRQITRSNPAHSVRGPKYVVKKGKTPVWSREDAKMLLDSISKDSVSGLRDLALIAAVFYSFISLIVGWTQESPLSRQPHGTAARS
jgi:site-specific recombinase XerC